MSKKRRVKFKDLPTSVKISKIITYVFGIVAVLCLGYFVFYVNQAGSTQDNYEALSRLKNTDFRQNENAKQVVVHINADEDAPEILPEYVTLYNNNKSLIGWIKIDDTIIDYPVMQSSNEDYYLNHNFDQEEDNNGSIFIDADCSIWPRSQNLLIYGHNMKSGKMFGSLKQYKNESFCKEHPYIQFDTLYEKGTYKVMYAFSEVVHDEIEVAFKYYQFIDANSEEEFNSNMNEMAAKSLYDTHVTATYGDQLITLSTCDYEKGAERFAVVAKKVK